MTGTRCATIALSTAIDSTAAIVNEATTHVEPQMSANCVMPLVSSIMNPAPSRKNNMKRPNSRVPPCRAPTPISVAVTVTAETTSTPSSAHA